MRKNFKEYAMKKIDVSKECFGKNVKPTIIGASCWNEEEDEEEKKRQAKLGNGPFGMPRQSSENRLGGDVAVKNKRLLGQNIDGGNIRGFSRK